MPHPPFLDDFAIVLLAAGVAAALFRWMRQPLILGYLLAGVVIGPHFLPLALIRDKAIIHTLAELGVVLLLFSHGLHFNLRRLVQVSGTALAGALLQMGVLVWVGHSLGRLFGWSPMDSLFLGALLSISSATTVYKVLVELKRLRDPVASISFGILVIEDAMAVGLLAVLSGVALADMNPVHAVTDAGMRLGLFMTLLPVAGLILVPRLLRRVGGFQNREALLLATLGLCFGITLLSIRMGLSPALGAFLAGALVAEARESPEIEDLVSPVRDMFTAVFFIATGMLLDPRLLLEYAGPVVWITLATLSAKLLAYSIATSLCGHPPRTALGVGLALAQIGEFSFIIAGLGIHLGVVSEFIFPVAIGVAGLTTLSTPYLIQYSDPLARGIWRMTPRPLQEAVLTYTRRRETSGGGGMPPMLRRLARRWMIQIALNLLVIAAVFLAMHWLERNAHLLPLRIPESLGGDRTLAWFLGVLLLLPVLVAFFRKLQAVSRFAAEYALTPPGGDLPPAAQISFVANALLVAAVAIVLGFMAALSSTLLPPLPVLAGLVLLALLLMRWLWNHFIRVYGRAQMALEETLAQTPPDEEKNRDVASTSSPPGPTDSPHPPTA